MKYEKYHQGYVLVHSPKHPNKRKEGYVKRSRLTMEAHIGRYLKPREVVHHINEIKDDDRIENLQLFSSNSEHISKTFVGHINKRKFLRVEQKPFPKPSADIGDFYYRRKRYTLETCAMCGKFYWTRKRTERKQTATCGNKCLKEYMVHINRQNWRKRWG